MNTLFELAAEELVKALKLEVRQIELEARKNSCTKHLETFNKIMGFERELQKLTVDFNFLPLFPETHNNIVRDIVDLCERVYDVRKLVES